MPPGIPGFGRESIREAGTRSFEQRPRVEWAGRTRQPPGASARTRRTLCCRFASLVADSSSNPVAEQATAWLGSGEASGVRRSGAAFWESHSRSIPARLGLDKSPFVVDWLISAIYTDYTDH